jgi:hypothetical protein
MVGIVSLNGIVTRHSPLVTSAHQRGFHQVLGQEPDLLLVGAQDIAHQQIIGADAFAATWASAQALPLEQVLSISRTA